MEFSPKKKVLYAISLITCFLCLLILFPIGTVKALDSPASGYAVEENDIRDIKGPVYFRSRIMQFLAAVLAVALLAAIVKAVGFFLKRKKESNARELKPYEAAYKKLKALKEKDLIEKGLIKEFYIELSDIARRYLEGRFTLKAPEMTTEEFLAKLRESDALNREHKKLLKIFLSRCDLVKFAKYGPDRSEINSSFESAKKLVEETREKEGE